METGKNMYYFIVNEPEANIIHISVLALIFYDKTFLKIMKYYLNISMFQISYNDDI